MPFKRNQVEEAIRRILEPGSPRSSSDLRIRLKRLLDLDRSLGRNKRSNDPQRANFAFYSLDAPGRGVEVQFSQYEAFALLMGLRLMEHGWPQGFAVSVLRQARLQLENQHTLILKKDPAKLFDPQLLGPQHARPGDIYVGNTDPVFFALGSAERSDPTASPSYVICRGQVELMRRTVKTSPVGWSWSIFELATVAHRLSEELAKTQPRKRGRGSI
jgi:hypothetical protein